MDELFELSRDSSYADRNGQQFSAHPNGAEPDLERQDYPQSQHSIPTAHLLSIRLVAMRSRATQKSDIL